LREREQKADSDSSGRSVRREGFWPSYLKRSPLLRRKLAVYGKRLSQLIFPYLVLDLLVMNAVRRTGGNDIKLTLLICVLYAISDETHTPLNSTYILINYSPFSKNIELFFIVAQNSWICNSKI